MDAWIAAIERRRPSFEGDASQAAIDVFLRHLRAERDGDLGGMMATLAEDGVSHRWGRPAWGPSRGAMSTAERRRTYEAALARDPAAFRNMELELDRFVAGPGTLAMDGVLRTRGRTRTVGVRTALFVTIRDGRMVGEDTYWDDDEVVQPP
jgi:ketosteroid isomerase-like protein